MLKYQLTELKGHEKNLEILFKVLSLRRYCLKTKVFHTLNSIKRNSSFKSKVII